MAWIRMEPAGGSYKGKAQFDAICEETDDLTQAETDGYAVFNGSHVVMGAGSIAYCAEDDKLHVLMEDGSFSGLEQADTAEETET